MANAKSRAKRQNHSGAYHLHPYTPEQITWLHAQHGKNRTTNEICHDFNQTFQANQSVCQIRQKLKRMGVAFTAQRQFKKTGFMSRHYSETGAPHPREKPIGTIRTGRDGLEIKVANQKGAGRKNWLPLAKHVYQTAHKVQIARDEMVLHIDGNINNNDVGNLILVNRRDIGAINMLFSRPENQNAPPEVRLSLILMARITQTRQAKTGELTPAMRYRLKQKQKKQKAKQNE